MSSVLNSSVEKTNSANYNKTTNKHYGWTDDPTVYTKNETPTDWTGLNPYDSSEYETEKAEEESRKRKEWEEDAKKNPTYVEQTFFGANGKKYYKMIKYK